MDKYKHNYMKLTLLLTADFVCPGVGDFEDPCDCRQFYKCGHDGVPNAVPCATDTVWDTKLGNCNWEYNVDMDIECAVVSTGMLIRTWYYCSTTKMQETLNFWQISRYKAWI